MGEVKILDCTLRDGGYVNEWKFGEENIKFITNNLIESGVDIIECGFLNDKKSLTRDYTLFSSIRNLESVVPLKKMDSQYVCMINYGDYNVDSLPDARENCIDGIRLAFHKKDLKGVPEVCKKIINKGYNLYIQPMVTIGYTDRELLNLIEVTNELKPYAFYIVDSFGVIKKSDLLRMFYLVDNNLDKDVYIGFHSHNNLQLAYSNAQELVEIRTKRKIIIDSSVFGMGRGAGNLNTELFMEYLNDTFGKRYKVYSLLKIIDEVLNKIYAVNYWGYSLPFYMSASCNCHPNYASYLSEKNTLTVKSINEILNLIVENKKNQFDNEYIQELYLSYQRHYIDDKNNIERLKKIFHNKKVIVIAPGTSIENYYEKINTLVNQKDIISVSVNFMPKKFNCDFTFVSNEKRFESLFKNENDCSFKTKLIITSNINGQNYESISINYSNLLNNINDVRDNSTLMLLNLLVKLNVEKVLVAGFDGYSYDNINNYADEKMSLTTSRKTIKNLNEGVVKVLEKISKEIEIDFITPTKYTIK
jgi:4-hydroxy 2-oxovalerate aldolase